MTSESQIDSILNAVWSASGKYWAGASHYQEGTVFLTVEEAKKQLYELIVGEMPKEKESCIGHPAPIYGCCPSCFGALQVNEFRESMLTVLKGLFQ